jgi:hypothetical protein
MKMVIPLCASKHEAVQGKAIEVVQALLPGFSTATSNDASFLWGYISVLLSSNLKSRIILAAIELLKYFPLNLLPTVDLENVT